MWFLIIGYEARQSAKFGVRTVMVLYVPFFCDVTLFGLVAADVSTRHTDHLRSVETSEAVTPNEIPQKTRNFNWHREG
jgi:hypothetical protein